MRKWPREERSESFLSSLFLLEIFLQRRKVEEGESVQSFLHLFECAFGLLEETKDDTLAKVAIVVVVHFEDLFKGGLVDRVGHVGELGGGLFGLWLLVDSQSQGAVERTVSSVFGGAMIV